MASFKRDINDLKRDINDAQPQKVVIVTGPSFKAAMEFMLVGAVMGAAATMFLQRQRGGATAASDDAVYEGLTGGGAKDSEHAGQLVERLTQLSHRLKSLAARTKETVQSAAEVVGPTIKQAVAEGKSAAQKTEHDLEEELHKPPSAAVSAAEAAAAAGPVAGM